MTPCITIHDTTGSPVPMFSAHTRCSQYARLHEEVTVGEHMQHGEAGRADLFFCMSLPPLELHYSPGMPSSCFEAATIAHPTNVGIFQRQPSSNSWGETCMKEEGVRVLRHPLLLLAEKPSDRGAKD